MPAWTSSIDLDADKAAATLTATLVANKALPTDPDVALLVYSRRVTVGVATDVQSFVQECIQAEIVFNAQAKKVATYSSALTTALNNAQAAAVAAGKVSA